MSEAVHPLGPYEAAGSEFIQVRNLKKVFSRQRRHSAAHCGLGAGAGRCQL